MAEENTVVKTFKHPQAIWVSIDAANTDQDCVCRLFNDSPEEVEDADMENVAV